MKNFVFLLNFDQYPEFFTTAARNTEYEHDFLIEDVAFARDVMTMLNEGGASDCLGKLEEAGCALLCVFDANLECAFIDSKQDAFFIYLRFPRGYTSEGLRAVFSTSFGPVYTKKNKKWVVQTAKNLAGMLAYDQIVGDLKQNVHNLQHQIKANERTEAVSQSIGDNVAAQLLEQRELTLTAEQNLCSALYDLRQLQLKYDTLLVSNFDKSKSPS